MSECSINMNPCERQNYFGSCDGDCYECDYKEFTPNDVLIERYEYKIKSLLKTIDELEFKLAMKDFVEGK